jgi:hypothetical protein
MRKSLVIFLITLTVFSCKKNRTNEIGQKVNWTEQQKRIYFEDSIANRMYNGTYGQGDSLNNFDIFSRIMFAEIKAKNKNDPYIYAFEEPYIDTTQIDSNKFWFRITVDPCFRIPYCLIVEKKIDKTYLTVKMTNGSGGYYSGTLDFSLTKIFSDTVYNNISNELHQLNFWKLGEDNISGGSDGETWTFEAIENGKYNLIDRWVPQLYGNRTTKQLGQLGMRIKEMSKLLDILPVINMLDERTIEWQKMN